MPKVTKLCILCGRWIKRSNRKRNDLCHVCIDRLTRAWEKDGLAGVGKEKNRIRRRP